VNLDESAGVDEVIIAYTEVTLLKRKEEYILRRKKRMCKN